MHRIICVLVMAMFLSSWAFGAAPNYSSYQLRNQVCLGAKASMANGQLNAIFNYKNFDIHWGAKVFLIIPQNECYSPEGSSEPICQYVEYKHEMSAMGPYTWSISTPLPWAVEFAPFRIEVISSTGHLFREEGIASGYENTTIPFTLPLAGLTSQIQNVPIVPPEGFKALENLGECKL